MIIQFLFVCEGSSDGALVHHIQRLLIEYGATEANGVPFHSGTRLTDSGTPLTNKVRQGLKLSVSPDLLFVHRDADHHRDTHAAGAEKRYEEIVAAVQSASYGDRYVGIVPVRMTEAWLLLNECEIRRVAGNPGGRDDLGLPTVQKVEKIADPKNLLKEVLLRAESSKSPRRRKIFGKKFGEHRRQLIENLPVGGPLEHLDSWARFRKETIAALQELGG